ncbi:AraC family transcriptional regulator [Streptococcus sp. SL1232]|nr:AraC family transcriptional regulator [Streptococcus vicugnae]
MFSVLSETLIASRINISKTRRLSRALINDNPTRKIKEVAITVGYTSHSRFASLFKKYIGVYPHDIKKQTTPNKDKRPCHDCLNKFCEAKVERNNQIKHKKTENHFSVF